MTVVIPTGCRREFHRRYAVKDAGVGVRLVGQPVHRVLSGQMPDGVIGAAREQAGDAQMQRSAHARSNLFHGCLFGLYGVIDVHAEHHGAENAEQHDHHDEFDETEAAHAAKRDTHRQLAAVIALPSPQIGMSTPRARMSTSTASATMRIGSICEARVFRSYSTSRS